MNNNYDEFETLTRYNYCQEFTDSLRSLGQNLSFEDQHLIYMYLSQFFSQNFFLDISTLTKSSEAFSPLETMAYIMDENVNMPLEVGYGALLDILNEFKTKQNWNFLDKLKTVRLYIISHTSDFYIERF